MFILALIGWLLVTIIGLGILNLSILVAVFHIYFLGFNKELKESWSTLGLVIFMSLSVVYYSFANTPF